MANFALDTSSPTGDIISSLNYALTNLGTSNANVLVANPNGSIYNATTGYINNWQYRWMNIRYATNATGSQGFSTNPNGATYYGILDTADQTPSNVNNPASYTWTQVAGGFSTNKYLFYSVLGGYRIQFYIGTSTPGTGYLQSTPGQAIDLSVITVQSGSATNGVTASVNPSIVVFPQFGNLTYPIGNTLITATFTANTNSVQVSSLYANINTQGLVTIQQQATDPTINVTTINSNTTANVLTITFAQPSTNTAVTSVVNTQVNGTPGNSRSIVTLNAWTLSNVFPRTPLQNSGSYNFSTLVATPPLDPNSALNPYSVISSATASVNTVGDYTFYTFTNGGGAGAFTVSDNPAVVDILLVGGGGGGAGAAAVSGYVVAGGGGGGQVVVLSNVSLSVGSYTTFVGAGGDVTPSSTTINGGTFSAIAYGGAGGVHTVYPAVGGDGRGGSHSGVNGGPGVADPWNQITWVGQQSGGVAYFGGGGGGYNSGPAPAQIGTGGIGGGTAANSNEATAAAANTGGGGGGSGGNTVPTGYGGSGVIVIRQYKTAPNSTLETWTLTQPNIGLTSAVYQSTTTAATPQSNPTANVTALTWSQSVLVAAPVPPSMSISYPQGSTITNNQGIYNPAPVGNVVTLTANVQAFRGNSIIAAVNQLTQYFTANGQFNVISNAATAYNANVLVFGSPQINQFGVYQTVSYGDIGGNVNSFINETLQVTTQGNIGPRGFVPLAYIIANTNPTTANTAVLNAMFSANRSNTTAPIGVGYPPVALDTAQFYFANTSPLDSVTSVLEYDGTSWANVQAQVVSGSLIVTGTITAEQLNANEIYTLDLASTDAYNQFGNTQSLGFWLVGTTGDAHFAGNTTIGGNLSISNLFSGGTLNANTVGITQISNGSITTGKLAANLIIASNIASTNATFNNLLSSGYWLNGVTGDARFGGNINIGDNLTVGNNAKIGGNLNIGDNLNVGNNAVVGDNLTVGNNTVIGNNLNIGGNLNVAGLVTAGNLRANTVTGGNSGSISYNTISYNNLSPSVTTLLGIPVGGSVYNTSYNLTGTGSYDFNNGTYGYVKNLGYSLWYPTRQAAALNSAQINLTYTFTLTASGYPTGSNHVYLYLYMNSATQGGINTINLNPSGGTVGTGSVLFDLGSTGPDEATFASGSNSNEPVVYGGTFVLPNTYASSYPYASGSVTFGLALTNTTGAGTITITNFAFNATYP